MLKHQEEVIVDLITKISMTNSPKLKYQLLCDFCIDHAIDLTSFTCKLQQTLVKSLREKKDIAAEKGKSFAKRKTKALDERTYASPAFFATLPNVFCSTCNMHLVDAPGFLWKKAKDEWYSFCPLPACFPSNLRQSMSANYKYNLWLQSRIPVENSHDAEDASDDDQIA